MSYIGCKIRCQDSSIGPFNRRSHLLRPEKKLSMTSLVTWNISKVLETCPSIDLKSAMRYANNLLEREARDGAPMMSLQPEEQYLTCALLAWHQLGHKNTDSLYEFIEANKVNENVSNIKALKQSCPITKGSLTDSSCFDINSLKGPVVKLPLETKVVMHVQNHYQCCNKNPISPVNPAIRYNKEKQKEKDKDDKGKGKDKDKDKEKTIEEDLVSKIDAVCCTEPACVTKLAELDAMTAELRLRASRLAKREAERIELLERAEAAWKDLEIGYQRRLRLAKEKEDDTNAEIKRILEERNAYKVFCKSVMEDLRKRSAEAEAARDRLTKLDKDVCSHACMRLQLSEEAAQGDAAVAEAHCRITQMDRDLQMKEQQARRKILSLESDIASNRGLLLEAERVIHADVSAIKENIKSVTAETIDIENKNNILKTELNDLSQKKLDVAEALNSCTASCDKEMQNKIDELQSKKKQLAELKERVLECRCKIPQDVSIEVKRTPSLVALCSCMAEDNISESCSCTSLRTQLMSNLITDLFDGLQSELGVGGSTIPCQLLKCLADGHNWERASALKTELHDYFSKMLVEELNIAIATSIEKYHVRWVGDSCVDNKRAEKDRDCQERAIKQRAQELRHQIAEQVSNERTAERAKERVSCGSPHCPSTAYPCLVKPPTTRKITDTSYLKRKLNDVTQLRVQVEELKKESIKKEDLRHMEDKLTRVINQASKSNKRLKNKNKCPHLLTNTPVNIYDEKPEKEKYSKPAIYNKGMNKLEELDSYYIKNNLFPKHKAGGIIKHRTKKAFRKIEETYAVNMCLCDNKNISNNTTNVSEKLSLSPKKHDCSCKSPANMTKESTQTSCPNECICFHKVPSNTSIIEMLKTFTTINSSFDQNLKKCNKDSINTIPEGVDSKTADVNEICNCRTDPQATNNDHVKKDSKDNYMEKLTNIALKASEYVGAINLDKSNEDLCECFDNTDDWKNENVIKCTPYIENMSQNKFYTNLKDHKDMQKYSIGDKNSSVIGLNLKNDNKGKQKYDEDTTKDHFIDCIKCSKINGKDVHHELHISDLKENSNTCGDDYQCCVNKGTQKYDDNTIKDQCICIDCKEHSEINGKDIFADDCQFCVSNSKQKCDEDTIKDQCICIDCNEHSEINGKDIFADDCQFCVSEGKQKCDENTIKDQCICIDCNERSEINGKDIFADDCQFCVSEGKQKCDEDTIKDQCICIDCNERSKINGKDMFAGDCQFCVSEGKQKCDKYNIKDQCICIDCNRRSEINGKDIFADDCQFCVSEGKQKCDEDTIKDQCICIDCNERSEINGKENSNIKENSDIFADDFQCCVKFLGVTIADTNNNTINPTVTPNIQFDTDVIKNDKTQSTMCCELDNMQESKLAKSIEKSEEISTCFSEKSRESCVCCTNDENFSEIEVNAFNLLKEHLKEKVKDIKQTSVCKQISLVEEEKIYINILNEVKQLITDSTYEVSCKCIFKSDEGSWMRAYDLLKEYLKIKIDRAQCNCNTKSNAVTVLPTLLEKVSALIQSDFERLKMKFIGGSINENKNDENKNHIEVSTATNETKCLCSKDKEKENTSAQVSYTFNSQHKSCDPINENQNINKIEKKVSCDLGKNVYITDCDCCYSFIERYNAIDPDNQIDSSKLQGDMYDCDEKNDKKAPSNQIETSKLQPKICEIDENDKNILNNQTEATKLQYDIFGYDEKNDKNAPNHQIGTSKLQRHIYETDLTREKNIKLKDCSDTFDDYIRYIGCKLCNSCCSSLKCTGRKFSAEEIYEQIQCSCKSIMNQDGKYNSMSYIMDREPDINNLEHQNDKLQKDMLCKNINTDYDSNIVLKNSYNARNGTFIDSGTLYDIKGDKFHPTSKDIALDKEILYDYYDFPETTLANNTDGSVDSCSYCDCENVPICHVKMLVDDIKNKLIHSECICDSLCEEVCPLHSKN